MWQWAAVFCGALQPKVLVFFTRGRASGFLVRLTSPTEAHGTRRG